ncbi:MAG: ferritin-like domain-containing protein [Pseudoflavonifractor sp.]
MEQEQVHTPETGGGAFASVWRRAMPEDRPDCPFVLEAEPPPVPRLRVEVIPAEGPREAMPPAEYPREVFCLGAASGRYGARLQELIADELADFRTYTALARRLNGSTARVLAGIAAEEHRHAKRLATAYFLISGVRYWPDRAVPLPAGPLHATLRDRFLAEQSGDAAYRQAAEHCADPCLCALYRELSGQEADHAWKIRGLLEEL